MSESSVPEIRLSDVERDQVITQLNMAMSEGRLDVGEFEARSRLVYAARVPSDLAGVLEGLPVAPLTSTRSTQPAEVMVPAAGKKRWFFSLIGDQSLQGDLNLGDTSTSISVLGDTTFDLTQVTSPTVNLRLFCILGDVTVMVRPGTRIDSNVFLLLGDRSVTETGPAAAEGMDLRLRVVALIGDVKVRVVGT